MRKVLITSIFLIMPFVCLAQENSIQSILAKAKNIGPVQFEIIYTYYPHSGEATKPSVKKCWQKPPNIKIMYKVGKDLVPREIIKSDVRYHYYKDFDIYEKISFETVAKSDEEKTFEELAKEIGGDKTLKVLGTEILDGKLATIVEVSHVYEGKIKVPNQETFVKTLETKKMWIWNEKGIPLKSVIDLQQEITENGEQKSYTFRYEYIYKDFKFEDIPDSVFEVPRDKIREEMPRV